MAVTVKNLMRIMDLPELLPAGGAILELGAQQVYCQGHEDVVRQFVESFTGRSDHSRKTIARFADGGYFGELLTACGFDYRSVDLINGFNTFLLDLNMHSAPEELSGRFDLVTNFGTTEHLINQLLAMKTVHEVTKPGGIIYHDLPMSGYLQHGYFLYTPVFFNDLAAANGYRIVRQYYSREAKPAAAPEFMRENGFPDPDFTDFGIEFILQKTSDAAFRMPLDPTTSLRIDQAVWNSSRPGDLTYSSNQATSLDRVSGRELQRALFARYRKKLARWFKR
ncbi:MAG TPA: methyltransferase domain-containing protein [Stellaceae bacterium]|nr:methyltransferase domain-containing protein [Stellaceae bacterium]